MQFCRPPFCTEGVCDTSLMGCAPKSETLCTIRIVHSFLEKIF